MDKSIKIKNLAHKIINVDNKDGIIEAYINGFNNKDADGDISLQTSFNRTIKNQFKRIKHLYSHSYSQILGLPLEFKTDDYGLATVSKINLSKQLGQDVFSDYLFFSENGRTLEHSIGAMPIKEHFDNNLNANIVEEWKLYEYSTVAFGANENTETISIKEQKQIELDFDNIYSQIDLMLNLPYSDNTKKQIDKIANLFVKFQPQTLEMLLKHSKRGEINEKDAMELINKLSIH